MRPYGEWLAEQTVVLQQIIDAVPEEQREAPPVLPAGALSSNGASHVSASPHEFVLIAGVDWIAVNALLWELWYLMIGIVYRAAHSRQHESEPVQRMLGGPSLGNVICLPL